MCLMESFALLEWPLIPFSEAVKALRSILHLPYLVFSRWEILRGGFKILFINFSFLAMACAGSLSSLTRGSNPSILHWKLRVSTTGPAGVSKVDVVLLALRQGYTLVLS